MKDNVKEQENENILIKNVVAEVYYNFLFKQVITESRTHTEP